MTQKIEKEEIIEGNKLMARFLDYDYYGHNDVRLLRRHPAGWKTHPKASNISKFNRMAEELERIVMKYLCRSHNDLAFDRKWDGWLMEIVAKIESFHIAVSITGHECYIFDQGVEDPDLPWLEKLRDYYNCDFSSDDRELSKIQNTWVACLKFIIWYNENVN